MGDVEGHGKFIKIKCDEEFLLLRPGLRGNIATPSAPVRILPSMAS